MEVSVLFTTTSVYYVAAFSGFSVELSFFG